ncbi:MAG TPA: acyltransferase [Bryobacteraceae bacterium]|jgi:peptidoglycan/LPS O-acetylase OafA/YrhL|nr:acyltransferase [Bryobacteraceae bacterium]
MAAEPVQSASLVPICRQVTSPFRKAACELFGPRDPRVIPWLDFCRALAILLVLGSHSPDFGLAGLGAQLFTWGWAGVDLFFVLSGYLIAKQLWSEVAATGSVRVGRFLLKRGLRIWPLYYAAIVTVFLLDFVSHRSPKPLLADLFCVSDYFHHQVPGGWSLSVEEQFYLILPVLLFLLRKLPPKALLGVPVAWFILLPLLRRFTLLIHPDASTNGFLAYAFHTHTDGLAIGVILAWLSVFAKNWWRSGAGKYWIPAVAICCGLIEHKFHTLTFAYTGLALLFGGLVLVGLRASLPNRLTHWRILHVISRLSYGSYLNNLILVQLIDPYTHSFVSAHATNTMFFVAWFAGFVLVSNAVAFVTYALIEAPFLEVRERWLSGEKRSKQPVAPPVHA